MSWLPRRICLPAKLWSWVFVTLVAVGCSGNDKGGPTEIRRGVFTVSYDSALVVGHTQTVTITSTTHDENEPAVLMLTPQNARLDGCYAGVACRAQCRVTNATIDCTRFDLHLQVLAAGDVSLKISQGGLNTALHEEVITLPIQAQRVTIVETRGLDDRVRPNRAYRLGVRLLDQLGAVMHGVVPTAVSADAAVAIDSVSPGSATDSITAVVWLHELHAGVASVRVSAGEASSNVSLQLGVAADDSAVVIGSTARIAVTQNDDAEATNLRIIATPLHGSAIITDSTIRFTAADHFVGADSLRYAATAAGRTDTATVNLSIMGPSYDVGPLMSLAPRVLFLHMNDSGEVAGYLMFPEVRRAFRWRGARLDTLSSTGAVNSVSGIDNAGNVIGVVDRQAVRWRPGASAEERLLPFVVTMDRAMPVMSRGGTILIPQMDENPDQYIVHGAAIDTVRLTVKFPEFSAINDAGDITGRVGVEGSYAPAFVRYVSGVERIFALGGRGTTIPSAIDTHGAVLARAEWNPIGEAGFDVILYDGGRLTDLTRTYGLSLGRPVTMNDTGRILFAAETGPYLLVAGAKAPVQSLLKDQSVHVDEVFAINNVDQILAAVHGSDGATGYAVLTPSP